jgi:nucleotide-binding universal stress UspA family protein
MYKKILVALDGSEPSNHALEHAASLANKYGAKLILVAVVQRVMIPIFPDEGYGAIPLSAAKDMAQYQDKMRVLYQNILREAEEKIREEYPRVKFESILKEGRPSATIVEQAESYDVDIIVIGCRGIGGYTGWILGSTSRRVVDSCTKPILIVK